MRTSPARVLGLSLLALATITGSRANAHFRLEAPPSWYSQDALGSPQKQGPCGDEGGGMPTGTITAFQQGQMITVTINETVFHPGHYRFALATNDRSQLPPEPPVTAGATACGTVPIQNPPVFPVIADGVFKHTQPFNGPQSVQIALPPNVTCSKCTLQVLEFMSNHGAPCFYHHCADISIATADGGLPPPSDAGTSGNDASAPPADAGGSGADGSAAGDGGLGASPAQNGCACSSSSSGAPTLGGVGLFLLVASLLRRRAR